MKPTCPSMKPSMISAPAAITVVKAALFRWDTDGLRAGSCFRTVVGDRSLRDAFRFSAADEH